MPEGDTIHRTARTLERAIGGRKIVAYESPLPELRYAEVVGRTVRRVYARGKNLFIELDDDRSFYSHMKMDGSWHVYRPGERWRMGAHRAVVSLETDAYVAVCFDAPVMELLTPFQIRGHPALKDLGPDLIADDLDPAEILRRFREHDSLPIGVAVMTQRIVAGIGNVYKSEVLFIHRKNPFAPVSAFGDDEILAIVETSAELLKKNLTTRHRKTRFELSPEDLWIYDRSGRPCPKCGETIRMARQGSHMRSTYYCRACQRVGVGQEEEEGEGAQVE